MDLYESYKRGQFAAVFIHRRAHQR